jgi:hypothetical protein
MALSLNMIDGHFESFEKTFATNCGTVKRIADALEIWIPK